MKLRLLKHWFWCFFLLSWFLAISAAKVPTDVDSARVVAYIVPHSHCDPGWKVPIQTYYAQNVSKILHNVIAEMEGGPLRRFIWSEVVYFKMWWETNATNYEKKLVRQKVKSGHFEFVMGGWVMNDEAVTDYVSIIQQLTEGHRYLHEVFGDDARPEIGWQIDPFGASHVQPWIHARMGYKYHIINRIDDRLKFPYPDIPDSGFFRKNKFFQFWWEPQPRLDHLSSTKKTDTLHPPSFSDRIFSQVLYDHYSAPKGFDFEAGTLNPSKASLNPLITPSNKAERAWELSRIILDRAKSFRTNLIMVPFGDDFRFQDAELEFDNLEMLMREINGNSSYGMSIRYATLGEYFSDLMKLNDAMDPAFPVWEGAMNYTDFFPYARCLDWDVKRYGVCAEYWTGFYTSYPLFIKSLSREVARFQRWADSLFAFPQITYSKSIFDDIRSLRRTISLMQHHDLITGTFMPVTRDDSVRRLREGQKKVLPHVIEMTERLLNDGKTKPIGLQYEVGEMKSQRFAIVLFNALSYSRTEYFNLTIKKKGYLRHIRVVTDGTDGDPQEVYFDAFEIEPQHYELFFLAEIPPLGYRTYFVINDTAQTKPILKPLPCDDIEVLRNPFYSLDFYKGVFRGLKLLRYHAPIVVYPTFWVYEGWEDDTYKFRPYGKGQQIVLGDAKCTIVRGGIVSQLNLYSDRYELSQTWRLFSHDSARPHPINMFIHYAVTSKIPDGKEIAVRFSTSLDTAEFWHDMNGLDYSKRRAGDIRFGDNSEISLIAGNYYPMSYISALRDDFGMFMVLTRSSLGVGSHEDSTLEIMLNRNTMGINPGQINCRALNPIPHEFYFYANLISADDLYWHRQTKVYEAPLSALFLMSVDSEEEFLDNYKTRGRILETPVDRAIHLLSIERRAEYEVFMRFQNLDNWTHHIGMQFAEDTCRRVEYVQEVSLTGLVNRTGTKFDTIAGFDILSFRVGLEKILPKWARVFVVVMMSVFFFLSCIVWWIVVLCCVILLAKKTRKNMKLSSQYRSINEPGGSDSFGCSPSTLAV